MSQDDEPVSEDRSKKWPNGANDTSGGKRLYSCSCGAVSSSPINHKH